MSYPEDSFIPRHRKDQPYIPIDEVPDPNSLNTPSDEDVDTTASVDGEDLFEDTTPDAIHPSMKRSLHEQAQEEHRATAEELALKFEGVDNIAKEPDLAPDASDEIQQGFDLLRDKEFMTRRDELINYDPGQDVTQGKRGKK